MSTINSYPSYPQMYENVSNAGGDQGGAVNGNSSEENFIFLRKPDVVVVPEQDVFVQPKINVHYKPAVVEYKNDTQQQKGAYSNTYRPSPNSNAGQQPSSPAWRENVQYKTGETVTAGNHRTYKALRETTGEGPWSHTAPGSPYAGNNPAWAEEPQRYTTPSSIQPPNYNPYGSNTPRTIRVDEDPVARNETLSSNYVTRTGESTVEVYQPRWHIDENGNKIWRTPDQYQPPEIKGFKLSSGEMKGDHAVLKYERTAYGENAGHSTPPSSDKVWTMTQTNPGTSPDGIATGTGFKANGQGGYDRDLTVLVPPSSNGRQN